MRTVTQEWQRQGETGSLGRLRTELQRAWVAETRGRSDLAQRYYNRVAGQLLAKSDSKPEQLSRIEQDVFNFVSKQMEQSR
jgi:hypothetical protein